MRALMIGVIGVAVLRLSDRLAPGEDADQLAEDTLKLTLAGLQSGVVLHSPISPACPLEQDAGAGEVANSQVHQFSNSQVESR
jgi:hypothetical protein